MPDAVRKALRWVIEKEGGLGEEEARKYVQGMEDERRLQEETWS